MSEKKYISFFEEKTIIERIDNEAKKRGVSRSDIIREAIRQFLGGATSNEN